MEFELVISQISKLIMLIGVGVFARKKGILNDDSTHVLSRIMLNITLPILTFFSITSYRLPKGILKEGAFIVGLALAVILVSFFVGKLLGHVLNLPDVRKNVYAAQLMIGNTVFLAFPLMQTLFGEIGLIYAIIYYLVSLTFIWTLGVYLFNKHEIKNFNQIIHSLINPCTVAFLLGLGALILRIDMLIEKSTLFGDGYTFLYETLYPLGNTTMSLSMLFIGSIIGKMELKKMVTIFRDKSILIFTITKMILIPLLFLFFLRIVGDQFSQVAKAVIFIETLMPASTITVAIAKENKSDYQYAMEIAIVTTIVCILTIPLLLWAYEFIAVL